MPAGPIAPSDVLVRVDRHLSAVLGDEVVMLDVDKGSYHLVDAIGTFVWQQLERPTAVASLIDTLQDRYDVTPERCEDDVLTYLEDLLAKGLIRHSERGA